MKNELRTLLITSVLGLPVLAGAQEPSQHPETRTAPEAEKARPGAKHWIEQLGSDSYRERLEAERRLRELGDAAVPQLEAAAKDAADGEVQWRARRLLRQMQSGGGGGLVDRQRGGQGQPPQVSRPDGGTRAAPPRLDQVAPDEMRDEFDRLFRRFEQDFGIDVPRGRFFSDDFFRDLQDQMQAMGQGGQSSGMSMQVGPDGVRVEVDEVGADGKTEKKVYEAPDMKTFREQYPDVLKQNGLGMGLDLQFGDRAPGFGGLSGRLGPVVRGFDQQDLQPRVLPFDRARRAQRQQIDLQPDATAAAPLPPAGRRLGVVIRELPDQLREYLELDPSVGLMVAEVQDGTLAQDLGLQANDIVVKIGEQAIGSPADVQAALGALGKGDKVVVEFVRKGRRQTAEAPKREDAEPVQEQPKQLQERGTIR
ncbi:MAG: PDZ domain-containing protein [Planctomycetes bacterium]|nr:PDZ domain-containing protein [Planctomycetota bacterium]